MLSPALRSLASEDMMAEVAMESSQVIVLAQFRAMMASLRRQPSRWLVWLGTSRTCAVQAR